MLGIGNLTQEHDAGKQFQIQRQWLPPAREGKMVAG
jgi:hypothetical protein